MLLKKPATKDSRDQHILVAMDNRMILWNLESNLQQSCESSSSPHFWSQQHLFRRQTTDPFLNHRRIIIWKSLNWKETSATGGENYKVGQKQK